MLPGSFFLVVHNEEIAKKLQVIMQIKPFDLDQSIIIFSSSINMIKEVASI